MFLKQKNIRATIYDFEQCGMCNQQRLRPDCAYAQSAQSICQPLKYAITVKLLITHNLECLKEAEQAPLSLFMSKCHIDGNQMGLDARKPVFGGLRTTQTQTSLRISPD